MRHCHVKLYEAYRLQSRIVGDRFQDQEFSKVIKHCLKIAILLLQFDDLDIHVIIDWPRVNV